MAPVALERLTDLDAVLSEGEILTRHTIKQFVTAGQSAGVATKS